MTTFERIEYWGDRHHPAWMDALRVALGIFLFFKGLSFIMDYSGLADLVNQFNLAWSVAAIHYVAFAHLVGGLLIAAGCLTRIAIAFQIPILVVAVFFVNITRGFSPINSELWISFITLILLSTFLIIGSGKYSVDTWMKENLD
ncbi:MAG: DoxX family protein [Siphonobacter sp.]